MRFLFKLIFLPITLIWNLMEWISGHIFDLLVFLIKLPFRMATNLGKMCLAFLEGLIMVPLKIVMAIVTLPLTILAAIFGGGSSSSNSRSYRDDAAAERKKWRDRGDAMQDAQNSARYWK